MQYHKQENILQSFSLDCTIKLWDLTKYYLLFDLKLDPGVTHMQMLTNEAYALTYKNRVEVWRLNLIAQHYLTLDSKIENMDNKDGVLIVINADSSCSLFDSNKKRINIIYPPPSTQSILTVNYFPFAKQAFALLGSGAVCCYDAKAEACKLIEIYYPDLIKDQEGKGLGHKFTSMCAATMQIPSIDYGTASKYMHYDNPGDTGQYIVAGLSNGFICFFPINNFKKMKSRILLTTNSILHCSQISSNSLISICSAGMLFVIL
jgi:WD40 repeat protein